jgi:hypothetical protein
VLDVGLDPQDHLTGVVLALDHPLELLADPFGGLVPVFARLAVVF